MSDFAYRICEKKEKNNENDQTKEMRKQAKLASREREMQELRASVARFHKIYLGFQLDREQENLAKIQARIIED